MTDGPPAWAGGQERSTFTSSMRAAGLGVTFIERPPDAATRAARASTVAWIIALSRGPDDARQETLAAGHAVGPLKGRAAAAFMRAWADAIQSESAWATWVARYPGEWA